jgi:signal transduction histidine kinase
VIATASYSQRTRAKGSNVDFDHSVPEENSAYFSDDYLNFFSAIYMDGERIWTIFVKADTTELRTTISEFFQTICLVLLVSLLAAYLLSRVLGGIISKPIVELENVSNRVSTEGNYSFRILNQRQDEVGRLIDGFNNMLARIELRDHELKNSRDFAENANRSKSQFLANMSHKIRTPLNGILSFSKLLKQNADDGNEAKRQEWLESVVSSGEHLLEPINDVLDLSIIESGSIDVRTRPVCSSRDHRQRRVLSSPPGSGKRVGIGSELRNLDTCDYFHPPTAIAATAYQSGRERHKVHPKG